VGAVFLDLSKAFDTVNHSVLLSRLSKYNLSIETLNWIQSYLANRMQCVRVKNILSTLKPSTTGVPQGSILGPLLFSIYINDLPAVCKGVDIIMYTDDAVIYTHGRAMDKIRNWLKSSCLTLNTKKLMECILLSQTNVKICLTSILMGKNYHCDRDKYLGVHLKH